MALAPLRSYSLKMDFWDKLRLRRGCLTGQGERQGWSSFDPSSVGVLERSPLGAGVTSLLSQCGGVRPDCPSGNGILAALPSLLRRGLPAIRKDLPAASTQWGPCFSSLNQYYPRLSDNPGEDVGLMQGAGIFLAISRLFTAPLREPSSGVSCACTCAESVLVCVCVWEGEDCPQGACVSSTAGSGFWVLGSPSSSLEHGLVLALSFGPSNFLRGLL